MMSTPTTTVHNTSHVLNEDQVHNQMETREKLIKQLLPKFIIFSLFSMSLTKHIGLPIIGLVVSSCFAFTLLARILWTTWMVPDMAIRKDKEEFRILSTNLIPNPFVPSVLSGCHFVLSISFLTPWTGLADGFLFMLIVDGVVLANYWYWCYIIFRGDRTIPSFSLEIISKLGPTTQEALPI